MKPCLGADKDVVHVDEDVGHLRHQVVHQSLKRLCHVFQPKGHVYVQAKRGDDRGLWHISISNRYLVKALDQVNSAEDAASGQLVPQVLHVGQGRKGYLSGVVMLLRCR